MEFIAVLIAVVVGIIGLTTPSNIGNIHCTVRLMKFCGIPPISDLNPGAGKSNKPTIMHPIQWQQHRVINRLYDITILIQLTANYPFNNVLETSNASHSTIVRIKYKMYTRQEFLYVAKSRDGKTGMRLSKNPYVGRARIVATEINLKLVAYLCRGE